MCLLMLPPVFMCCFNSIVGTSEASPDGKVRVRVRGNLKLNPNPSPNSNPNRNQLKCAWSTMRHRAFCSVPRFGLGC